MTHTNTPVFCTLTNTDLSTEDATLEQFADILLQLRDMWSDDLPVIRGMRKTYLSPEDAQVAMGTMSPYHSDPCPTCGRVYSTADMKAHLATHTPTDLRVGACKLDAHNAHNAAYVAAYANKATSGYTSESEGLTDTTELSDAHVRESGMYLSVEIVSAPTGKCINAKCMQKCEDSALVYMCVIEEGKEYTCVHGTHWREVWEQSYTHARWDHLRDAHLQAQADDDMRGHVGNNPKFGYLWRQKHTRIQRMRQLTTFIANVSMKQLLHTDLPKVLKGRRNLTVAKAVGFSATPVGKWDGVSGSSICGLIRDTPITLTYIVGGGPLSGHTVPASATCRRYADWSDIYLTKEDLAYLNILVSKRLTGKTIVPTVVSRATPPTLRHK